MTTPAQRRAFGAALLRARKGASKTQVQLAELLHVNQTLVSAWERGDAEPPPERVFAVEDALGVEPGGLSQHLGYVPVSSSPGGKADVVKAVSADPMLSKEARRRLLALYRTELETAS